MEDAFTLTPVKDQPAEQNFTLTPAAPTPPDLSDPGTRQALNASPLRAVWDTFKSNTAATFGDDPIGFSNKNLNWLMDNGLFNKPDAKVADDPVRTIGRAFLENNLHLMATIADTVSRGVPAVYRGLQAVGVENLGLPGDIVSLPDAFMGSPGALKGGAPSPGMTGIARLDTRVKAVLSEPAVRAAIDGGEVNRANHVPYEAGASATSDVTNIDKSIPPTAELPSGKTFDTATPMKIHEQVEKTVMERLTAGGMDEQTAYKVSHYEFAEKAEDAWYEQQGIDPKEANKWWEERSAKIQHEPTADTPPDLYDKPYPHDQVSLARAEGTAEAKPTPAEIAKAHEILGTEPGKVPDFGAARDLGIIGEERPPLTEGTPADAAKAATQRGNGAGDRPPPPGAPGGPPEQPSAWRQRFEETLDKMETPADAKALIMNAVDRNSEFADARQGRLTLAEHETLAEATGLDPSEIDPRATGGMIKTNEQMRNIIQGLRTIQDKIRFVSEKIAGKGGVNDAAEIEELTRLQLQHDTLVDASVEPFVALRAEFGRTGNVLQEFMKAKNAAEDVGRVMRDKMGRTADDMRDIAKMIAQTPAEDMAATLKRLRISPPGAYYWTWVQGLISGVITHVKYLAANELFALHIHGLETPLAAAIGKIKEVVGLGDDTGRVFGSEAIAGLIGHFASIPTAFMTAGRAFKTGIKPPLESEVALYKQALERGEKPSLVIERANAQIPQQEPANFKVLPFTDPQRWFNVAARKLVSVPGRSANAIHTFFRILGEASSREAQAVRATINDGIAPTDPGFMAAQRSYAAHPTDAMLAQTVKDAYYNTFMQELGPAGKMWQLATRNVPGLRWLFPFMHIPINILKAGAERTPFAFAGPEMRANLLGKNGSLIQDQAISRMVVGSSVLGFFAFKYLNGQATGDYPVDPKERSAWKISGKVPNALLIGDRWYSFNKFGPAGSIANLGANFGGVWQRYQKGDDDAFAGAAWKAAESAGHFVSDEVGFQGLANIFEAMQSENKAVSLTSTTVASAVPFSSLLSQTAAAMDPNMREVKTFLDGLKYRLPGARETLMPKRDWLGMPVDNPAYGSVVRQSTPHTDPVSSEAIRLGNIFGHYPAPPQDRIQGVKLSPALYEEYQATAGPYTRMMLDGIVRSPGWASMPDYAKDEAFRKIIQGTRQGAQATILMRHPELISQALKQRTDLIAGVPK